MSTHVRSSIYCIFRQFSSKIYPALTLSPPIFFVVKMSDFTSAAYIVYSSSIQTRDYDGGRHYEPSSKCSLGFILSAIYANLKHRQMRRADNKSHEKRKSCLIFSWSKGIMSFTNNFVHAIKLVKIIMN